MCSVNEAAGGSAHQSGGLVCQVGYQVQDRAFGKRPVDRERRA